MSIEFCEVFWWPQLCHEYFWSSLGPSVFRIPISIRKNWGYRYRYLPSSFDTRSFQTVTQFLVSYNIFELTSQTRWLHSSRQLQSSATPNVSYSEDPYEKLGKIITIFPCITTLSLLRCPKVGPIFVFTSHSLVLFFCSIAARSQSL